MSLLGEPGSSLRPKLIISRAGRKQLAVIHKSADEECWTRGAGKLFMLRVSPFVELAFSLRPKQAQSNFSHRALIQSLTP